MRQFNELRNKAHDSFAQGQRYNFTNDDIILDSYYKEVTGGELVPSKWYIDHQQGLEFKPQNASLQRQNLAHNNSTGINNTGANNTGTGSAATSSENNQGTQTPLVQQPTGAAVANSSEATNSPRFGKASRPVSTAAPETPSQPPQQAKPEPLPSQPISHQAGNIQLLSANHNGQPGQTQPTRPQPGAAKPDEGKPDNNAQEKPTENKPDEKPIDVQSTEFWLQNLGLLQKLGYFNTSSTYSNTWQRQIHIHYGMYNDTQKQNFARAVELQRKITQYKADGSSSHMQEIADFEKELNDLALNDKTMVKYAGMVSEAIEKENTTTARDITGIDALTTLVGLSPFKDTDAQLIEYLLHKYRGTLKGDAQYGITPFTDLNDPNTKFGVAFMDQKELLKDVRIKRDENFFKIQGYSSLSSKDQIKMRNLMKEWAKEFGLELLENHNYNAPQHK